MALLYNNYNSNTWYGVYRDTKDDDDDDDDKDTDAAYDEQYDIDDDDADNDEQSIVLSYFSTFV